MKKNAVFTLIKDILLAAVTWGVVALLIAFGFKENGVTTTDAVLIAMGFAGIPFGWRWSSKIITAVSFKGIILKLLISIVLGWLAIFIVLAGDVIRCIAALISHRKQARVAKAYGYADV